MAHAVLLYGEERRERWNGIELFPLGEAPADLTCILPRA